MNAMRFAFLLVMATSATAQLTESIVKTQYGSLRFYGIQISREPVDSCGFMANIDNPGMVSWDSLIFKVSVRTHADGQAYSFTLPVEHLTAHRERTFVFKCSEHHPDSVPERVDVQLIAGTPDGDEVTAFNSAAAEQAAERKRLAARVMQCESTYRTTIDKKVADLTVRQSEEIRACQAAGLYTSKRRTSEVKRTPN